MLRLIHLTVPWQKLKDKLARKSNFVVSVSQMHKILRASLANLLLVRAQTPSWRQFQGLVDTIIQRTIPYKERPQSIEHFTDLLMINPPRSNNQPSINARNPSQLCQQQAKSRSHWVGTLCLNIIIVQQLYSSKHLQERFVIVF